MQDVDRDSMLLLQMDHIVSRLKTLEHKTSHVRTLL